MHSFPKLTCVCALACVASSFGIRTKVSSLYNDLIVQSRDSQASGVVIDAPCSRRPLRKYALVLVGGVSRIDTSTTGLGGNAFTNGSFVNISVPAEAYKQNLMENRTDLFDVYIHSWSESLQSEFELLYDPAWMVLENNLEYEDDISKRGKPCRPGKSGHKPAYCAFGQASAALSRYKALTNLAAREDKCGGRYVKIIVARPDVVTWGRNWDIFNDTLYNPARVTANAHDQIGTGDFHWVMGSDLARNFSQLYNTDGIDFGRFGHIRDFIKKQVTPGKLPAVDHLMPRCVNEAVYRQVRWECGGLLEELAPYGYTTRDMEALPKS